MRKEWFIKEGGQVCFKSEDSELNGWDVQSLVDCLNGKEIKIAQLEEQLKNAIVPKFKIGQEVWFIEDKEIANVRVDDMWIEFCGESEPYFNLDLSNGLGVISKTNDEKWLPHFGVGEYYVYATKEQAEAKLKELQDENR